MTTKLRLAPHWTAASALRQQFYAPRSCAAGVERGAQNSDLAAWAGCRLFSEGAVEAAMLRQAPRSCTLQHTRASRPTLVLRSGVRLPPSRLLMSPRLIPTPQAARQTVASRPTANAAPRYSSPCQGAEIHSATCRRMYGGGHDEHKPVRKPGGPLLSPPADAFRVVLTYPQVRYFTRAEVAEHSFVDDAWIVIHGRVYNITPWVPQHPGGNIILAVRTHSGCFLPLNPDALPHSALARMQLICLSVRPHRISATP